MCNGRLFSWDAAAEIISAQLIASRLMLEPILYGAFAQLTYRENLRDINGCLRSRSAQFYRLGLRGALSSSTSGSCQQILTVENLRGLGHALDPNACFL
jgi:hypothetical protein